MHPIQLQAPRCGSLRTWLIGAIATTAAASGAWADEPSPYYIGASTSFTHDSNVYRVADGPGDNYWSVGLLGGLDLAGAVHFRLRAERVVDDVLADVD